MVGHLCVQLCLTNPYRVVAIVVGFCFFLIFFFVPETFWERTPTARGRSSSRVPKKHRSHSLLRSRHTHEGKPPLHGEVGDKNYDRILTPTADSKNARHPRTVAHVGFADDIGDDSPHTKEPAATPTPSDQEYFNLGVGGDGLETDAISGTRHKLSESSRFPAREGPDADQDLEKQAPLPISCGPASEASDTHNPLVDVQYSDYYRSAPPKSYVQSLKPWNGRLAKDKWLHAMIRPFILLAYPAVLWSSMVYG